MNEANVRLQVRHALEAAGYDVTRLPDAIVCKCGNKIVPESGRADLEVTSPTKPAFFVEAKVLRRDETSFAFSEIRDDQREWLNDKAKRGYRVYLALGIIRPAGSRSKLRELYFIPWQRWLDIETLISPIQCSVPYLARKGFAEALQANHLDLVHLLRGTAMERTDGAWRLPRQFSAAETPCGHPISSIVSTDEGTHYCKECKNAE